MRRRNCHKGFRYMSIFRGFLLASAVACASGAALASTVAIPVVVEEEQFFLEDGQNLTYTFSGLPRTIGSGGELLIIGDSLNQTSPPDWISQTAMSSSLSVWTGNLSVWTG